MAIVVADVETRARFTGNQIHGRIADIDRGKFKIGWRELSAAVVERRLQSSDQRDQPTDWIVRALGISDMTLPAADDERAVERAATSGFDGVAERLDIARLAENAVIEFFAALSRPFQKLDRAVDGDA